MFYPNINKTKTKQKIKMLFNKQNDNRKQSQLSPKSQQIYIMLRTPLQQYFNKKQWKEISLIDQNKFQQLQNKILTTLFDNEQLFNKYFTIFYQNHVTIYEWYLLAGEKHNEIKLYVYKRLLRKSLDQYISKHYNYVINVKQMQKLNKSKQKQKDNILYRNGMQDRRCKADDLTQQIFNFMTNKIKTSNLLTQYKQVTCNVSNKNCAPGNSLQKNSQNVNLKQGQIDRQDRNQCFQPEQNQSSSKIPYSGRIRNKNKQNGTQNKLMIKTSLIKDKQDILRRIDYKSIFKHDFHDLYIKTFHACDGPRYIFYNYQRHMKGLNQKDKYNMFIRGQNKNKPLRLTQNSEYQNLINQIKSSQFDTKKTIYEYSSFGSAIFDNSKKKFSKVIFRRIKSKNNGKFIRK